MYEKGNDIRRNLQLKAGGYDQFSTNKQIIIPLSFED
jgi:hypothetical protein